MSDDLTPEERELQSAFGSVSAPSRLRRSLGQGRPSGAGGGGRRGQALAAVIAVALLGGIAGTYLGLHGGHTAGSGGGLPARSQAALAFDPERGQAVLFGGIGVDGRSLSDTWLWDGTSWSQAHPDHAPSGRAGAQEGWDPVSRRVILLGGIDVNVQFSGGSQLSDEWAWDGHDWSQLPSPAIASRSVISMATDEARGRLVALTASETSGGGSGGGIASSGTVTAVVVTANAVPPSPSVACPANAACATPRCLACPPAPAPVPAPQTQPSSITWVFDGSQWQQQAAGKDDPGLFGAAMVWSPSRQGLVMSQNLPQPMIACVQGQKCPSFPRIGAFLWNGTAWSRLTVPQDIPFSPQGSAAGDDSANNVVRFSGIEGRTYTGDGVAMTDAKPAHSPSPRTGEAMAYDSRRNVVILVGGTTVPQNKGLPVPEPARGGSAGGAPPSAIGGNVNARTVTVQALDDTWTWDGHDWSQKTGVTATASPAPASPQPTEVPTSPAPVPCKPGVPAQPGGPVPTCPAPPETPLPSPSICDVQGATAPAPSDQPQPLPPSTPCPTPIP
jgi:hypothetical protein